MTFDAARPSAPDAEVLERAARALGVAGERVSLRATGDRIDRGRSTVFPLAADGRNGIVAYYKSMASDLGDESENSRVRARRTRDGLSRAMALEQRLSGFVESEPIAFSRSLAVDPDRLIVVTLAVEGAPFGATWRHLLTPGRHRIAEEWMRLTGRAARLIEECTVDEVGGSQEDAGPRTASRMRRLERIVGSQRAREVGELLSRFRDDVLAGTRPMVYAHGDLSSSNILLGEKLGLIDFAWAPRMRGYDLAKLAFRIEYGTALPRWVIGSLVEALVEGFGDPLLCESPQWSYHRLWMLTKVVADQRSGQPRRLRRAGREIDAILAGAQ